MIIPEINKALFIINPISGDIEKVSVISDIETFCMEEKINASFFYTSGNKDLSRMKAELKKVQYDTVVAVGGDGTVHLAGAALFHSQLPLGILPMGSGNGLSKDV